MKGIFSVLVENKDGVLSQISGLFARRGFNIDSLAVGETERHDISSMTYDYPIQHEGYIAKNSIWINK